MAPQELEKVLQELNPHLNIRRYWTKQERNDGVYYGNKLVCAIPSGNVYPTSRNSYRNRFGIMHRGLFELFDILFRRGYITYQDRWKLVK